MSHDSRAIRSGQLHRRDFLAASAALGAALLVPGPAQAAEIHQLKGNVRVNGKRATRATRIRSGGLIETGPDSNVAFVVGQDAFLLREQSRLSLDKSKAGKEAAISGLRLMAGALLAVFGKGPRAIETATATAGIKGAGVYLEAGATETYFCTCYGEAELRARSGNARKLVISAYHTPTIIYARMTDGKMMTDAPFKDHTDAELIMLARLVGRTSPIEERDKRLGEGGEPTQLESPRPEPTNQIPAQAQPPQPKVDAPPRAETPAAERPHAPSPIPPPEPAPLSPKPETPPSDLEWRLPPPRLN
jgi:hypothetical protein